MAPSNFLIVDHINLDEREKRDNLFGFLFYSTFQYFKFRSFEQNFGIFFEFRAICVLRGHHKFRYLSISTNFVFFFRIFIDLHEFRIFTDLHEFCIFIRFPWGSRVLMFREFGFYTTFQDYFTPDFAQNLIKLFILRWTTPTIHQPYLVVEIIGVFFDIAWVGKFARYTTDDDSIARRSWMSSRQ